MICDHLKLRDEHDVYIYTVLLLVNLKELNLDKGLHRCGCGGLLQLEKLKLSLLSGNCIYLKPQRFPNAFYLNKSIDANIYCKLKNSDNERTAYSQK